RSITACPLGSEITNGPTAVVSGVFDPTFIKFHCFVLFPLLLGVAVVGASEMLPIPINMMNDAIFFMLIFCTVKFSNYSCHKDFCLSGRIADHVYAVRQPSPEH